jgi:aldose 1-epimerase
VAITVPAESYLEVDDRLLPIKISPVAGTAYDLRDGPVLGSVNLDTALTDLARDADGRWRVKLVLGNRYTEVWGDATMHWIQVFSGGPSRNSSIAVEPMTCGPDAFNAGPTHDGMRVLTPGQIFVGEWGISGR